MKISLKTFPADAQSVGIQTKKQSQNFDEIKNDVNLIKFEIEKAGSNDGLKLLGELLGELRRNKEMSTLMICRQIKEIKVNGKIAEIYGDDETSELLTNENSNKIVQQFFEKKGLGFAIKNEKKTEEDEAILKRMLGKKLVIKNN